MIRLSRVQLREVDRIAIEEYGLPGIVLMENAARSAAELIDFRFRGDGVDGTTAIIIAGGGNNGGDGFAIARHLHNDGWQVSVLTLKSIGDLRGDAEIMARVAYAMSLPIITDLAAIEGNPAHLLIDAVTGTGLTQPLKGSAADAVDGMNRSKRRVVAIDVPSGLDCDIGAPLGDRCVKADLTITFVAEKFGFSNRSSREYTGDVVVCDIGCPREIIERVLAT